MKYKIKTTNKDLKEAVIEKTGHKITFTLNEVEAHIGRLETLKKECETNIGLEEAKQKNMEMHYPAILTLTEKERHAVYLYQQSENVRVQYADKLTEVVTQLEDYAKETADIKKQIPELS